MLVQIACVIFLFASSALAEFKLINSWANDPVVGVPFDIIWQDATGPVNVSLFDASFGPTLDVQPWFTLAIWVEEDRYTWTPGRTGRNLLIKIHDTDSDDWGTSPFFTVHESPTSTAPSLNEPSEPPIRFTSISTSPTQSHSLSASNPSSTTTTLPSAEPGAAMSGESLSTGAKAGIGIGAGIAVILCFLIYYLFYRRGKAAGLKESEIGGSGGGGGNNGEPAEFGVGGTWASGIYSPEPESELGFPHITGIPGFNSGMGELASGDKKSIPSLPSSIPDAVPVHGAARSPLSGTVTAMTPTNGSRLGSNALVAGRGDRILSGGRVLNNNSSNLDLHVAPPNAQLLPPMSGIYEMPTEPSAAPGMMHMGAQGHEIAQVDVPLVSSQPYVVHTTPAGIDQPMRMSMQSFFFNSGSNGHGRR
ncbi:hypothetical protein V8F20_009404 [Naviculisporaceae sp. PSN 640]